MRQPLSIYVRSQQRSVNDLMGKVRRRLRKLLRGSAPPQEKPVREARALVSREAIKSALDALGLRAGDAVLVHSGISKLGKVAGGPRAIFDLLREQVGEEGHVLFPVFPFNTLMKDYLATNPSFDARTSPSKMGALTEYALKVPGGVRSVHPTHSVLAFGPHGASFVAEHHLCATPFADASPFGRLVDAGGKILLMGVGLSSTTSFHRTEDRMGAGFPVRVYTDARYRVACLDAEGAPWTVETPAHDPSISRIRDCNLMREPFLAAGVMRELAVGDGTVSLLDAASMDRALEELCRNRRYTIYGTVWG